MVFDKDGGLVTVCCIGRCSNDHADKENKKGNEWKHSKYKFRINEGQDICKRKKTMK
jgi:NRPS condensation-like uncharacterized protein